MFCKQSEYVLEKYAVLQYCLICFVQPSSTLAVKQGYGKEIREMEKREMKWSRRK